MSVRERPLPEVEPLVYFGRWCGPGWSAGHRSTRPLTQQESRVGGAWLIGSANRRRQSPVDLACKRHDTRYDAADRTTDPLKRAQIIWAADIELLNGVSALLRQNESGKADLNMGEVLFAMNMRMAFRSKLIMDGREIVAVRTKRAIGRAVAEAVQQTGQIGLIVLFGLSAAPRTVIRLNAEQRSTLANFNPMWGH